MPSPSTFLTPFDFGCPRPLPPLCHTASNRSGVAARKASGSNDSPCANSTKWFMCKSRVEREPAQRSVRVVAGPIAHFVRTFEIDDDVSGTGRGAQGDGCDSECTHLGGDLGIFGRLFLHFPREI